MASPVAKGPPLPIRLVEGRYRQGYGPRPRYVTLGPADASRDAGRDTENRSRYREWTVMTLLMGVVMATLMSVFGIVNGLYEQALAF